MEVVVEVAPFNGLEVTDHFSVDAMIGTPQALTIRVDDRLRDDVEIGVRDGLLHVGLRPGIRRTRDAILAARVTALAIDRIRAVGASTVRVGSPLTTDGIAITLAGSSSVTGELAVESGHVALSGASMATLSGNATTLEVSLSGASHLYADELAVTDLTIDVSGASTADVNATGTLAAGASGASHIRYAGAPSVSRSTTSGASSIVASSGA